MIIAFITHTEGSPLSNPHIIHSEQPNELIHLNLFPSNVKEIKTTKVATQPNASIFVSTNQQGPLTHTKEESQKRFPNILL